MSKSEKSSLGQFFTTNVNYILQGMEKYVKGKNIIDPFAGNGDLLKWARKNDANSTKGFDIDNKLIDNDNIYHNDSFINIPKEGDFILTNPPYLGKNKMSNKDKNKYQDFIQEDLYLFSIKKIIDTDIKEGILIVPVNFLSADNSNDIRRQFLSIYNIIKINYFKEQVFEDTTYNVISFYFIKDNSNNRNLNITYFPNNEKVSFDIQKEYFFKIGGEEISKINNNQNTLKIKRLTEKYLNDNKGSFNISSFYNDYKTSKTYDINKKTKELIKRNIIVLNCIDGKINNKICAEDIRKYNKDCLVGKNTSRNIAYILLNDVSVDTQEKLIVMFNKELNLLRDKYNSLFLTNFRDNDRKRISFDFCYNLLNYCYSKL